MKILFISDYYPPYIKGGAEVSTSLLANELVKKHTVHVVCTKLADKPWVEQGVQVYPLIRKFNLSEKRIYLILKYAVGIVYRPMVSAWNVVSYTRKFKPDVINVVPSSYQFIPVIIALRVVLRIPVIIDCRDYSIICPTHLQSDVFDDSVHTTHGYRCLKSYKVDNKFLSFLIPPFALYESIVFNTYKYSLRFLANHSRGIRLVAVSQYVRNQLMLNGFLPRTVEVIPNISQFVPLASSYTTKKTLPTFTFAARLEQGKGVWDIVKAAEILHKKGHKFVIQIAGSGEDSKKLEAYIHKNPSAPLVMLHKVKPSEVVALYSQSTAILGPSQWYEPFGRFILEAISVGKPVIATRVGGIPEAVNDKVTGLLIKPQDPVELSQAIAYFIDHPEKSDSMKPAILAKQREYTAEVITRRRLELYNSICK